MKRKISVPTLVFLVHLIICTFISFDWPFLEGMYMGFAATFLIIWGFTLPVITACVSGVSAMIQVKKKEKLSLLDIITAVAGCDILLIYIASASGLLKHFALSFVYIFVFVGTLFIWVCWGCRKSKKDSVV